MIRVSPRANGAAAERGSMPAAQGGIAAVDERARDDAGKGRLAAGLKAAARRRPWASSTAWTTYAPKARTSRIPAAV